jgi:hypothetical protein
MNKLPALRRTSPARATKILFALGLAAAAIGGVAAAEARHCATRGGDRLDALRVQYRALQAQVEPCAALMRLEPQPSCAAAMPGWTAQAATLAQQIYVAQREVGVVVLAPQG